MTSSLEKLQIETWAFEYMSLVYGPIDQQEGHQTHDHHASTMLGQKTSLETLTHLIQFMFSTVTGWKTGIYVAISL